MRKMLAFNQYNWHAILLFVAASSAGATTSLQAQQIVNRGRYEVFVAFGAHRDRSIAGLGDNGYSDPEAGLYTSFWTRIPAGESIEIPRDYSGYVRVIADINGRHHAIAPERPMEMSYFPLRLDETQGGAAYVRASTGDANAARQAIQKQGFLPKYFFPLAAFQRSKNSPYEVLASEQPRRDLERQLGFRRLAVVGFINETSSPITFGFRWLPQDSWTSKTLGPNQRWMWWSGFNPVRPEISIDEGINIGGNQARRISVRPFDVQIDGGETDPTFDQASQYRFVANGNRLQVLER